MRDDGFGSRCSIVTGNCKKLFQSGLESTKCEALEQLRPILDQLNTGNAPELPLRVQTVLNGIKGELVNFQSPLQICKSKSRLYLLTNCQEVVREIQKTTHGIGRCLARLPSVQSSPRRDSRMWDVGKKADDLAREMQQALFMVQSPSSRYIRRSALFLWSIQEVILCCVHGSGFCK